MSYSEPEYEKSMEAMLDEITDDECPNAVMYESGDIMSLGYGMLPKMIMKDTRLSKEAKLIYCHLSCYAGAGPSSYPSRDLIARETGIPYKSLGKYIKELRAFGYIKTRERRNKRNEFASNLYIIQRSPVIDGALMEDYIRGLSKESERRRRYRKKVSSATAVSSAGSPSSAPRAVDNSDNTDVENSPYVENSDSNYGDDLHKPRSTPLPSWTVTGADAVQDGNGPMPSRTVTANIVINNRDLYNQQSIYPSDSLASGTASVENRVPTAGDVASPDGSIDGSIVSGEGSSASPESPRTGSCADKSARGPMEVFERLCAMSIKPVRDEARLAAWKAFCSAAEEGCGYVDILEAYKHYRRRYFAEQRSVKYSMQLRDWLTRGGGLTADLEMMAAERGDTPDRASPGSETAEMLMRATDDDLKRALRATDEGFASLCRRVVEAEKQGKLDERARLIDESILYFNRHRKQAKLAWLAKTNTEGA